MTRQCQCEHACHDSYQSRPGALIKSPNGNPGHRYGQKFEERALKSVKTAWGTFEVCPSCLGDCCVSIVDLGVADLLPPEHR